MGFRDENEALRRKVDMLERELADARSDDTGPDTQMPKGNLLLGGPTTLTIERTLPGEIDDDRVAEIIARLRKEVGEVGRIERIGKLVAWSSTGRNGRLVELTIEAIDGGTLIRITESLKQLVSALFGGGGGGLGGGGIIIPMMIPRLLGIPGLLALTIPAWLLSVYGLLRAVFKSKSKKRYAALSRVADDIVASDASSVRARVEEPAEEEEEIEAVEEQDSHRTRSS